MNENVRRRRPDYDRPLFDTPTRAAMNAHRSPVRNGRTCDQCGLANSPSGWLHSGWATYIDYPRSTEEGFGGLVLCALCYVGHVETAAGPSVALEALTTILRQHQQRVTDSRRRDEARQANGRISEIQPERRTRPGSSRSATQADDDAAL